MASERSSIRHYGFGFRIVVQQSPARTRVAAARRSIEFPDLAAFVQLIKPITTGYDRRSGRIVVQLLPGGTNAACREAEDLAAVVQLIEPITTGYDRRSGSTIVEHLPARTGVAAARGSGEVPDLAAIVQLVEMTTTGYDRLTGRIIVQHLPAGT